MGSTCSSATTISLIVVGRPSQSTKYDDALRRTKCLHETGAAATDGCKPLGMHISAIKKFMSDHPDVVTRNLTTSQINLDIVKPETVGTNKPYIDRFTGQYDESGLALIAPATVFVSHAWKYSFADTVVNSLEQHAAKEPDAYFWFDLFTNDQNSVAAKDFYWFESFKDSIREIGKMLIILSPWHSPILICRAWCLFEVAIAFSEEGVEPLICFPPNDLASMSSKLEENSGSLIQALSDIQAEEAEATSEDDRNKICSVIRDNEGGFASINNHVKACLRESYVEKLQTLIAQSSDSSILGAVSKIMHNFGFYDQAIDYHKKVLSTTCSKVGEDHPDVATSYNNMATACCAKGDFEKALIYYDKSLSIKLSALEQQHSDVANSYNNMAAIYHSVTGELDKAIEYYQKSLSIWLSILEEHHPTLVLSYNNMANVYFDKGELASALEFHSKSLSVKLRTLGDQHPDVATSYNNIAVVYSAKGQLDHALKYYHKALHIMIGAFGKYHNDVASLCNNISLVYQRKGNLEKALNYDHKSQAIMLKTLGESDPKVAKSYNNMANVYSVKGEFDMALSFYKKSLSIMLSMQEEHHLEVADTYNNMAALYHAKKKIDEALEYYQKSLSIRLSKQGEEHPKVADLYNNMAVLYRDNSNLDMALEYYQKSVSISPPENADTGHANAPLTHDLL